MTTTDLDLTAIRAAWQERSAAPWRDVDVRVLGFIPALLAEVARLRAERDALRAAVVANHAAWSTEYFDFAATSAADKALYALVGLAL